MNVFSYVTDYFKYFTTYNKRFREISTVEDEETIVKPLIKESKRNLIISIVGDVVFMLLSGIPVVGWIFSTIGFVMVLPIMLCLLHLNGLKTKMKNLRHFTCDKCGTSLADDESIYWEEIGRRMSSSSGKNSAEAQLYVDVRFTCTCPKCGTTKVFIEKNIGVGRVSVGKYGSSGHVNNTEEAVERWINVFVRGIV